MALIFPSLSSEGDTMDASKTLGMTSAISLAKPKPSDLEHTRELEEYLRQAGMFEKDSELNHRSVVILIG